MKPHVPNPVSMRLSGGRYVHVSKHLIGTVILHQNGYAAAYSQN